MEETKNTKNTHRYIARVVLKAETGLFIGSGENSLNNVGLVQRDHWGLPMIQGTSLTGVIKHALEDGQTDAENIWRDIFGYQGVTDNDGLGSRLKISSAYLMIDENSMAEGITETDEIKKAKNIFDTLPIRQHVNITDKGVAKKTGLFSHELVYKGSQFIFEMELKGNESHKDSWDKVLTQLTEPFFRLGHGTRNGYGKLSVVSIKQKCFDLKVEKDFDEYLKFNPSLNVKNYNLTELATSTTESNNSIKYKLELKPDDFFIFSDGLGDEVVNNKPVTESEITYSTNGIALSNPKTLIPASSIKGALAHRTCFHFNKLNGHYADHGKGTVGTNNQAVKELFGFEASNAEAEKEVRKRGNVLIDDLYIEDIDNTKIFNHVAIDRFTGGAMDGALFSEQVSHKKDKKVAFSITLLKDEYSENAQEAFEEALIDVCKGLLPLGGMTTKGHGIFTGELLRDDESLYKYPKQNKL